MLKLLDIADVDVSSWAAGTHQFVFLTHSLTRCCCCCCCCCCWERRWRQNVRLSRNAVRVSEREVLIEKRRAFHSTSVRSTPNPLLSPPPPPPLLAFAFARDDDEDTTRVHDDSLIAYIPPPTLITSHCCSKESTTTRAKTTTTTTVQFVLCFFYSNALETDIIAPSPLTP